MDFVPGPVVSFSLLSILLIIPVAATLHLRRNALAATAMDRTMAWFTFTRSLRWISIGSLVLWWAAIDFTQLTTYTMELPASFGWEESTSGVILAVLLAWMPMLAVMVLCSVISQPVYAGVRGQHWTRGELARLSLLRVGTGYVPVIMVFALFGASSDVKLSEFVVWFGAAAAIYIVCLRALRSLIRWKPEALTSGELRDRIFAMAQTMGAKLKQVYVMPAGKFQMANAFASSANAVMLTDYLVSTLNRRETEAIVAHELAHVRFGHAKKRALITGAIAGALVAFYGLSPHKAWTPLAVIGGCALVSLGSYFLSRRFEYTADRTGVRLTGDAESMISALAKVHALNVFPVQWDKWNEKTMTHPSAMRRAMAIAKTAGFPLERVPEVVRAAAVAAAESGATRSTDGYDLPESTRDGSKVYSTDLKRRIAWQTYLTSLAATTVVPAAMVRGIVASSRTLPTWEIIGIAAAAAIACRAIFLGIVRSAWTKRIARLLHAKIEQQGVQTDAWHGAFVGFSPDSSVRIYDGSYSWDLGYLFFTGGRMCYWGEMARFALRREQVTHVRLGRGAPGWMRIPAVYVTWVNEATGKEETFRVACGNVGMFGASRKNRALKDRVTTWVEGRAEAAVAISGAEPASLAALDAPAVGATTSTPVRRPFGFRQFLASAFLVGFVTGCACGLFGIGVGAGSPVARSTVVDAPESSMPPGWCAIVASLIALTAGSLPFWFFRDAKGGDAGALMRAAEVTESN